MSSATVTLIVIQNGVDKKEEYREPGVFGRQPFPFQKKADATMGGSSSSSSSASTKETVSKETEDGAMEGKKIRKVTKKKLKIKKIIERDRRPIFYMYRHQATRWNRTMVSLGPGAG